MQQVNLYPPGLRGAAVRLDSSVLLRAGAALGMLLLVLYGWSWMGAWRQESANAELRARHELQASRLQGLQEAALPVADATLALRLEALAEQIRGRRMLLDVLLPESASNTKGFSQHLAGLARQHVDGLWLSRIAISEGGERLSLVGSSLHPQAILRLLEKLSDEAAFKGRRFRTFHVERRADERGRLDFVLSTERGVEL